MVDKQILHTPTFWRGVRRLIWTAAVLVMILTLLVPGGLLYAAPGVDGNLTVNAPNVVLNRYSSVTGISGNVVSVNDISELADDGAGHYANDDLSAGDMILIYQAQGAEFTDSTDSPTYGEFDYNSAGRYEFAIVDSVSGNDITVDNTNSAPYSCGGINNTYDVSIGNVQVVRVPQYINLTINAGGSIIPADWDGSTGGVVALLAQSNIVVDGQVDATGSGFRGGRLDIDGDSANIFTATYRQTIGFSGAVKGESILGEDPEYYDNGGPYGRGAPANGGGGGNNHNTGGGGGANGHNGGVWTGSGVPDTSDSSWDDAWDLDDGSSDSGVLPPYFSGGAGGGRGGYSYADSNQDATTVGPGNNLWGGNLRRQVGGMGGRPLDNDPANRVFFGGGGGAGDDNNFTGTRGAHGGGLVIITANSLSGGGQILSNGDDAEDIALDYEDGAGGGGAGGSIVIKASSVDGVTVNANGGSGGDNGVLGQPTPHPDESFGPGGGGGGGYIAIDSSSGSLTTAVSGGANGYSASEALSEFPPNGATGGYEGGASTAPFSFPGCLSPTAITLSAAGVVVGVNWWPVLVFLLLLAISGILLKGRPSPIRIHNR